MRRRSALALLLGALLTLANARVSPAEAHAYLVRSDPPVLCGPGGLPGVAPADPRCAYGPVLTAAPAAIRLWFSEPVQPIAGGISVRAPSGRRAERGPARVDGNEIDIGVDGAEEGTYLVRWRVLASDTHPTTGSFTFSVGHGSPSAGAAELATGPLGAVPPLGLGLQVLARWLHYAGFALGFGPFAFLLLVLRPALPADCFPARSRLLRLAAIGVGALLLAELVALVAETVSLAGSDLDPDLLADALGSSFGRVLAQRLAAALLLWTLLGAVQRGSPRATWAILGTGFALAAIDGQASHAGSDGPLWLGLALNAVHVAAMGVWLGGLVALLSVWNLSGLTSSRGAVVRRFGAVAAASLLLLILTGTAMAWWHFPQLAALRTTAYGRTLVVKLAMLAGALLPAFAASRAGWRLRRLCWRLEAAALAVLLAVAGLLVSLRPPR